MAQETTHRRQKIKRQNNIGIDESRKKQQNNSVALPIWKSLMERSSVISKFLVFSSTADLGNRYTYNLLV